MNFWPFRKKKPAPTQLSFPAPQASTPIQVVQPIPVQSAQAPVPTVAVQHPGGSVANNTPPTVDVRIEQIKSCISSSEVFEGNMRLQYGVKIDGHVIGNIEFGMSDGMCAVFPHAIIEGEIRGPRAIISGEVRGNIVTTGRLIVLPSARVLGDIYAGALQIHEGASISGRTFTGQDPLKMLKDNNPIEGQSSLQEHTPNPQAESPGEILLFGTAVAAGKS